MLIELHDILNPKKIRYVPEKNLMAIRAAIDEELKRREEEAMRAEKENAEKGIYDLPIRVEGRITIRVFNILSRNHIEKLSQVYILPPERFVGMPRMTESCLRVCFDEMKSRGFDYGAHWNVTIKELVAMLKAHREAIKRQNIEFNKKLEQLRKNKEMNNK